MLLDIESYHLPDVNTVDGLLDLISAATLAILGNVLDFRTYSAVNQLEKDSTTPKQRKQMLQHDSNAIPANERIAICYARGMGLAIFDWIRSCCVIKTPEGKEVEDLPSRHIVQILHSLLSYKLAAVERQIEGAPHCTSSMLKAQVVNVVKCDTLIENLWQDKEEMPKSLRYSLVPGSSIEWKTDLFVPRKCNLFI